MISFKKYILLKENAVKTSEEVSAMSPVEFANYLDSVLVGIKKGSDEYYEAMDSVSYDAENNRLNNYRGVCYWDAKNLISKIPPNALKFKKVTSDNTSELHNDYEYVANVNGVPYGLNRYEDPDYDPYGERDDDESEDEDGGSKKTKGNLKYVWAYQRVGNEGLMNETPFNIGYGDDDLMKEMIQDLGQGS